MGVLLALVLAASPSSRQEAEQLYKFARSDFAAESYKMALTEATRAYALEPNPLYLLEIAECQKALKRWPEAAVSYRSYLALREAKNRAAVRKAFAEVQAHLGGAPPEGGELAIAPLVAAPLVPSAPPPSPAPPALAPAPAPAPVVATVAPPPAPTPAPVAAVSEVPEEPTDVPKTSGGSHSRALAYTLLGVGVAAAAVGVVGWLNVVDYNSYVSSVSSGQVVSNGQTASQNQSSAQTWQIVAISTTVGTALAIGGVGLSW
jgi:hypothetical protein